MRNKLAALAFSSVFAILGTQLGLLAFHQAWAQSQFPTPQNGQPVSGAVGLYNGVSATPTTQSAAYSSGDVIGGKMTFANLAPAAGNGGILQGVTAAFKVTVGASALDLVLFKADPVASTFVDKTALAVASADLPRVFGVVHISDCTALAAGSESFCQNQTAATFFGAPTSVRTLFGVLVARGGITLTGTSDVTVTVSTGQ